VPPPAAYRRPHQAAATVLLRGGSVSAAVDVARVFAAAWGRLYPSHAGRLRRSAGRVAGLAARWGWAARAAG
jgi:hypothetical protein